MMNVGGINSMESQNNFFAQKTTLMNALQASEAKKQEPPKKETSFLINQEQTRKDSTFLL